MGTGCGRGGHGGGTPSLLSIFPERSVSNIVNEKPAGRGRRKATENERGPRHFWGALKSAASRKSDFMSIAQKFHRVSTNSRNTTVPLQARSAGERVIGSTPQGEGGAGRRGVRGAALAAYETSSSNRENTRSEKGDRSSLKKA